MKVLVTGACGFIGSHVCEALLARGDTVVGIDNFNDFYDPAIKEENRILLEKHERFKLVRGSILDPHALHLAMQCEPLAVVHLAAWAGVRPSIDRPALYTRENIDGTIAVMDAVRALGKSPCNTRIILASSSSVYGGNTKIPFHEEDPVDNPMSPYAATKRACELLALTYSQLYGLHISCLRFFTVYGPRQRPEMAIHKFAQLLADGKPVPFYGDGTTIRDYTYISDIVQGVLAAVDYCLGFRIYNLGNSGTTTLDELVSKLAGSLGVEDKREHLPHQAGDVPLTYADIGRARDELGYEPKISIDIGLKLFSKWFLDRRRGAEN